MRAWFCFFVVLFCGVVLPLSQARGARPAIYDEKADGAKAIAEAVALAKSEKKQILLQFGANWCGWCHKLHALFRDDPRIAEVLKRKFIVVMIDVNKEHNQEVDRAYGNPTRHGLPVLVVADAEGRRLTTKDTAELEEGDHHSPAKVLAFLEDDARPLDPPPW